MKINVEFDSIKEMDEWIGRMGRPTVQQHLVVNQSIKDPDCVEESMTDPTQEAKEEKPKVTRKRKASKPKIVKDEKEEAPQVPANTPFIEDEKEADVPTEQEAHEQQVEPEETEEAPVETKAEPTTDGVPLSITSQGDMVGFLTNIFNGTDEAVKEALQHYAGGLPQFIAEHLKDFESVATVEEAMGKMHEVLGV